MATSNKMPPINYLTYLDYYVLVNAAIILFSAIETRVLILLKVRDPWPIHGPSRYISSVLLDNAFPTKTPGIDRSLALYSGARRDIQRARCQVDRRV